MTHMGTSGRSGEARVLAITPVRNEADHLESVAASMAAQVHRPSCWVIVVNGSTDGTEAVADRIADKHPDWVVALSLDIPGQRSFRAKAHAVMAGVEDVEPDAYDLIACVDGDVVLPPDYFAGVAAAFDADPMLGVCGGVYREPVGRNGRIGRHSAGHVPGPAQVLRAETFRAVGGYWPLEFGGLDAAACYRARQLGWTTRALSELEFRHLRTMGTGGGVSRVRAEYLKGRQDWDLGNAPWFEATKLIRRMASTPYVLGGMARTWGYVRGALTRTRGTDPSFVAYVRLEERQRLRSMFGRLGFGRVGFDRAGSAR
jgi:glycosyltransferase involved in cell wall biosynthesis